MLKLFLFLTIALLPGYFSGNLFAASDVLILRGFVPPTFNVVETDKVGVNSLKEAFISNTDKRKYSVSSHEKEGHKYLEISFH